MLIRFAVENYNSFKDKQIFSMIAGKQTRHSSHCCNIEGKRLLKSSFFFGANASGKSNFVRALDFTRRVTLYGTQAMFHNDRYFRINPEYKNKPGVFQIDYIENHIFFSYGFAIDYSTHEIVAEWLYRLESNDKEICIFERENSGNFSTDLHLDKDLSMRFKIYREDLNKDQLLLNEIGNKNIDQKSDIYDIVIAYNWFKKLIIVYPGSHPHNKNKFFLNPIPKLESTADLLRAFDTGIEDIKKGKEPAEKAFAFLPDELRKEMLNDINQRLRTNNPDNGQCMIELGGEQFELSLEDDEIIAEKIMLDHGNPTDLFEISDESDGTKRLFDLLPLYELGQNDRVIIIDELDRSFHSKLTQEYIRLFFKSTVGKPSQLICTTHDLNLMNLQILRQDEIWFVEREKNHSSKIYSLNDYKQRFDKNILNDYLIGRYGAIPLFQTNDWQVECE